uniref:Uncharacterized protein n=1 Tax=Populus alba TaxID=43335 RepID=A0A4U5P5X5_POPAL|nr:hypothetical protein D5086_0000220290 [Populus alba]
MVASVRSFFNRWQYCSRSSSSDLAAIVEGVLEAEEGDGVYGCCCCRPPLGSSVGDGNEEIGDDGEAAGGGGACVVGSESRGTVWVLSTERKRLSRRGRAAMAGERKKRKKNSDQQGGWGLLSLVVSRWGEDDVAIVACPGGR